MMGVYAIQCKDNFKCYISSSSNVDKALHNEFELLKNNNHQNIELQSDYNQYGRNRFTSWCMKECSKNKLKEYCDRITHSIENKYNLFDDELYYNTYKQHSTGFKDVSISNNKRRGVQWRYKYFDIIKDGYRFYTSKNLIELKNIVLNHNKRWSIIDKNIALTTIREYGYCNALDYLLEVS